jgi:hypothetical protein
LRPWEHQFQRAPFLTLLSNKQRQIQKLKMLCIPVMKRGAHWCALIWILEDIIRNETRTSNPFHQPCAFRGQKNEVRWSLDTRMKTLPHEHEPWLNTISQCAIWQNVTRSNLDGQARRQQNEDKGANASRESSRMKNRKNQLETRKQVITQMITTRYEPQTDASGKNW